MITLRLGARHSIPQEATALTEALLHHPGSCDTVWFSTPYGYPPMDFHIEEAKRIAEASKIYQDAGIGFSLQISNTLGHGDYMKNRNNRGLVYPGSPAGNIVGPDGAFSTCCFCWRGEYFRNYIVESLKLYAATKPEVVWYDDDLCADTKDPAEFGCFCDNCIRDFNELYGSNFTRETLVHEINYGDILWRLRFIAFSRNGISDFVELMTRTIKEISPETKFGMQHAHWCNYMGSDDDFIMAAIHRASGEPAQSRPGGGYYFDKMPLNQYAKSLRLACTMSRLPADVKDRKAEVENLPDVVYGKSIGGTIIESTLHMAYGCTGLTYASIMRDHEPMEWHEQMFEKFSKIRPYWEKMSDVSKKAVRGGLRVYWAKSGHYKKLDANDKPFSWGDIIYENDYNLVITGIPVTHDQTAAGPWLLHHKLVPYLTDDDIRFLLTQPVVTDAAAVQAIMDRGFADSFHLKLTPLTVHASERFTEHPVNGKNAGKSFSESSFFHAEMPRYLIEGTDNETDILGIGIGRTGQILGGVSALTKTHPENGAPGTKWAVFGYCLWNDVISSRKRDQILYAADEVSPLPALLVSHDQAAVIPAVDDLGRTLAVTVSSASIGGSQELELLIRNPAGKTLTVMNTLCQHQEPLAAEDREDGLYVKLRALQPYEIVTVFFE